MEGKKRAYGAGEEENADNRAFEEIAPEPKKAKQA